MNGIIKKKDYDIRNFISSKRVPPSPSISCRRVKNTPINDVYKFIKLVFMYSLCSYEYADAETPSRIRAH